MLKTHSNLVEGKASLLPEQASISATQSGPVLARRHVLFVIDILVGFNAGAEKMLHAMVRRLPTRGYDCSLVAFKTSAEFYRTATVPCPFYLLPLQRTYDWNALNVAIKLNQIIRSNAVDLVHTIFETSDFFGGAIAKLNRRPLVCSRRDMGILRSAKHRHGYKLLSHMFTRVIAVSEAVRRFTIQQDGIEPRLVTTIPNGIDLEEIAALSHSEQIELGGASPVITTVGNVRPIKGTDTFIRAAARVCTDFPNALFLVIGLAHNLVFTREVHELVEAAGISRSVRFITDAKSVIPYLKASDIFCLPSRSEGMSNALLEAMACALPCVATQVGGNPEVVEHGENGFLVPVDDPEALACRIVEIARNRELAQRMGARSRSIIETRFTIDSMTASVAALYDEILAPR
jgi:glycosyltransferase involved in cell wall biosynthesis